MTNAVSVKLDMANDASSVTLTLVDLDGPPLAHVTLTAERLRSLVAGLAQALAHLETGQTPESQYVTDRPRWEAGWMQDGLAMIRVLLHPELWQAFSLTPADAALLANFLLSPPGSVSPQR